jgi:putative restriction endonuclease
MNRFISIGSRGTSIPTELVKLEPPLAIGRNKIRWAGRGSDPLGRKAHAWVSRLGESFELFPLEQAVRERRVIKVERAKWLVEGRTYEGAAFLPANWKPKEKVPQYVAVIGKGWPHGRIEGFLVNDRRNEGLVGTIDLPSQITKRGGDLLQSFGRKDWTREELLILMNVYEKLPFGQFDQAQPVIQDIAVRMARSPGSIAMKLCNLASLDPAVKARGRKGLRGASELDRQVWSEFYSSKDVLAPQSEDIFRKLFGAGEGDEVELVKGSGIQVRKSPPSGPTESFSQVTVRRGQQFFRQLVLNSFNGQCCVSGIRVRELLVASHVLPWNAFPNERLNGQNGLSLSRLHDGAFDCGLITFDERYRLVLSKELKGYLPQSCIRDNFANYEGKSIALPENGLAPRQQFLQYHREKIFRQ